jgi:YVTN family beta-propeller protein
MVWVMNADSGDISIVDPRVAKVVATVPVGGSLELGVAYGKGMMFVNVEDRNDVAVFDTRTRRLVERFPLAGCDGPTGIS